MLPTTEIEKSALVERYENLAKILEQKNQTIIQLERHIAAQAKFIDTLEKRAEDHDKIVEAKDKTIETKDKLFAELTKKFEDCRITINHEVQEIKTKYDVDRFQRSRAMAYQVCLEFMANGTGLTNEEILTFHRKKYPNVPTANVIRRVYELGTSKFGNLLFKHSDPNGITIWFLTLKPTAEDISHLDDSFAAGEP